MTATPTTATRAVATQRRTPAVPTLKWLTLALRVTMEAAIVAALAIVSLAYHGLVYLGGGRLLKTKPVPRRGSPAMRISPPAIAGSARDGGPR